MEKKAKFYPLTLDFGLHFCFKASHGQCFTYGLKTTFEMLVHVLAIIYLKIVFLQKSGVNHLPLNAVVQTPRSTTYYIRPLGGKLSGAQLPGAGKNDVIQKSPFYPPPSSSVITTQPPPSEQK